MFIDFIFQENSSPTYIKNSEVHFPHFFKDNSKAIFLNQFLNTIKLVNTLS